MTEKYPRQKLIRLSSFLFPPVGLVLTWATRGISFGRKLFITIFLLLYSLVYAGLVLAILWKFSGLDIEWRGGPVPHFTWSKTLPNYDALEASRASQKSAPAPVALAGSSNYWTGFRGPQRDGVYREQEILTKWPADGSPLLWKQPAGGGYASFAAADGRAFTIEQRRAQEVVVAYDIVTGRELWTNGWDAEFQEPLGGDGPRATPAWDAGKVYALGALGELRCLDAVSGQVLWRTNILDEHQATVLTYGTSASPLIYEDKLILAPGGSPGRSVVACDKTTGKPIWSSLDESAAYSSPVVVELAGERQLAVATKQHVHGLNPQDGKPLWEFPWVVLQGNRNIAQPLIVATNRFLLSAGYGTGCVLVEVSRASDGFIARPVWRNKNLKNKFTSSVFHDGHVYGLDEDILTCLDVATGERRWKEGRYGYGQVVLASGHLIILCGDGDLALVKATPERHQELSRFAAIEGKTWNHPALVGGLLLVRNNAEMACFDLRKTK